MKNGAAQPSKKRRPSRHSDAGTLEASIMDLAQRGDLAKPARSAIRHLRRKRLPITSQRGTSIIKHHADGRQEILGSIQPVAYRLPKGVKVILTHSNGKP